MSVTWWRGWPDWDFGVDNNRVWFLKSFSWYASAVSSSISSVRRVFHDFWNYWWLSEMILLYVKDNWVNLLPEFRSVLPVCLEKWFLDEGLLKNSLKKYIRARLKETFKRNTLSNWKLNSDWILSNFNWSHSFNLSPYDKALLASCYLGEWLMTDSEKTRFRDTFNSHGDFALFVIRFGNKNILDEMYKRLFI